jgi:hypothetical protein
MRPGDLFDDGTKTGVITRIRRLDGGNIRVCVRTSGEERDFNSNYTLSSSDVVERAESPTRWLRKKHVSPRERRWAEEWELERARITNGELPPHHCICGRECDG